MKAFVNIECYALPAHKAGRKGTALVGQGRPSEPSPKSSVTLEGTYTEPGALPNRAWKPLSVALDYELGN